MSKLGQALIAVSVAIALSLFLMPGTASAQDDPRISLVFFRTDYNSEVTPGEENVLYLKILNKGDIAVTDIRITAQPPKGWEVGTSPAIISNLGKDAEKTIDVLVTPDKYASRGSYRIQLIAEANDVKETITLYVTVDAPTTIWTWIGAGIACIVIAVFIYIFIRSGRKRTQLQN